MDAIKPSNNVSSTKLKRWFLQRWKLILLITVVVLCIIIVGFVVGYNKEKVKNFVRLPRSIIPEHYDLELQPYIIPDNFTFDGKVKILIKILESTDNVTLHVNDVTVDTKSVKMTDVQSGTDLKIASMNEDKENQFFILHFSDKLNSGSKYEIYIEYVGSLNDGRAGFYRSSYRDSDGNRRWLATTQFQPTDARRAFPCFDEPAMKATFNITLVRWHNMTGLSNMPIVKSEDRGKDWVADYFHRTVRMSTYLLAFIVSDFKSAGTPEFSVWCREDALNNTAYALDIGPKILKFYENFFHVPYPLPKIDMVAIPDLWAAAMENWGLITGKEYALLYDKKYTSVSDKQFIAVVVAHELAHQWFGNLVTLAWWNDLWLNEGFASYVEYLGVNAVHPEWKMDDQFILTMQEILRKDSMSATHPISMSVQFPEEIIASFDHISYRKGSVIIRMMQHFLGDRTFKAGLLAYLNAKKYNNAVQDDLWEYMTSAQRGIDRIDVKTVMDSWTLQKGYPVVEVIRNYKTNTAIVNQYRFMLEKEDDDDINYQWEVPFTITDGLNTDWTPTTKLWLHKTNGTISRLPGASHWIIGNIQEVGFYRVNYDERNWNLLAQQLLTDHRKIHTKNRAQIIDDSMNLARAGQLSYHLALDTTLYLKEEEDYLPWQSALIAFSFIDSKISKSAIYDKWKNYLMEQLKSMYDSLGWEESSDENMLIQFLRLKILGFMCRFGYKECVEKAQEKFEQWKEDPSNTDIIPVSLGSLVFCTAVSHGGKKAWNYLWKKYKQTEDYQFMDALACAREPWLRMRIFGMNDMVNSVISSFDTSFELSQLKTFNSLRKYNLGINFEYDIEKNIRWKENNYNEIVDFLDTVMKD